MRVTVLAASGLALALAACSVEKVPENQAGNDAETVDTTPEGPSIAARLFGGGKPVPLTIQQPLANGAVIYLTSIQAKETETVIGVKIVNGYERDIELDWATQKTFLAAGGKKYFLSVPVENKDLKVAARTTMEGELVFIGTIPRTGQLTLVFNDGMSDGSSSSTPGISIPIAVDAAAWSDDGSKKNSAASASRVM